MESKSKILDAFIADLQASRLPDTAARKGLRESAGLSSRQLASALGVTATTVIRWERGAIPSREHAIRYREVLDALRGLV
jgi:DNA-binding transcriptional regulator YiaG